MTTTQTIWDKIDVEEYLAAQALATGSQSGTAEKDEPKAGWAKVKHLTYWWSLKLVAVGFWIYVPARLFIGDVDRWVVSRVSPGLQWLLDYRFFFFLAALTVALCIFRRWIYLGAVIYIVFFPVILCIFYVPRFLSRQRTWMPTVGVLNVFWVTLRSIRFTACAFCLFAFCALAITVDAWGGLQVMAIVGLLGLWTVLLARACLSAVRPVSFIRSQQRLIGRLQAGTGGQNLAAPSEKYLRPDVVKLSKAEIDNVVMQASIAVCLYAAGYFMAEQLERYRKSGAAVIFSVVGIALLFLEAIAIFTLVNLGTWHVGRDQFEYASEPTFATFVRYTLNSLFPGEINALQPARDAATWVSIYSGVSVGIIVLTLVAALVFSVRSAREDVAATQSIEEMRRRSDSYAERLVAEYGLPLAQLVERLAQMGGAVNIWFRFVSDRIGEVRHGDNLRS